jgi:hypothetical protein
VVEEEAGEAEGGGGGAEEWLPALRVPYSPTLLLRAAGLRGSACYRFRVVAIHPTRGSSAGEAVAVSTTEGYEAYHNAGACHRDVIVITPPALVWALCVSSLLLLPPLCTS